MSGGNCKGRRYSVHCLTCSRDYSQDGIVPEWRTVAMHDGGKPVVWCSDHRPSHVANVAQVTPQTWGQKVTEVTRGFLGRFGLGGGR